jgi:hypothetical protein
MKMGVFGFQEALFPQRFAGRYKGLTASEK